MNSRKGAILVICLLVMVAMLLLGSALLVLTQSNYISAGVERDEKRALYTAFAGVEKAIYELNQDGDWSDGTPADFTESLTYQAGGNTYTGAYTVEFKSKSQKDVRIKSKGEVNNSERKIGVRVTR